MIKMSKSGTTPEMERADALAREQMKGKRSQHFAVDTYIMLNNRRGKVLINYDGFLLVEWEDGSLGDMRPHALNRSF